MKVAVKTLDNKTAGDVVLDDAVFGVTPRGDIVARVVKWQLARRRAGTHKTKSRSEVSATTAKMFKQKGTGRAVVGRHQLSNFAVVGLCMALWCATMVIICLKRYVN